MCNGNPVPILFLINCHYSLMYAINVYVLENQDNAECFSIRSSLRSHLANGHTKGSILALGLFSPFRLLVIPNEVDYI